MVKHTCLTCEYCVHLVEPYGMNGLQYGCAAPQNRHGSIDVLSFGEAYSTLKTCKAHSEVRVKAWREVKINGKGVVINYE